MDHNHNPYARAHHALYGVAAQGSAFPKSGTVTMADLQREVRMMRGMLSRSTNVETNDADKYGDGDQSRVKYLVVGDAGGDLISVWVAGGELGLILGAGPHPPSFGCGKFWVACALGLSDVVMAGIARARAEGGEALRHLL